MSTLKYWDGTQWLYAGAPGPQGPVGPPGPQGADSTVPGPQGAQGPQGDPGPVTVAGGDLGGNYPDPTVEGFQGSPIVTGPGGPRGNGSILQYLNSLAGWAPTQASPNSNQAMVWGLNGWGPANIVNQLTAGSGVTLSARTGTNCTVNSYPVTAKSVLGADIAAPGGGADFSVFSITLPIIGGAWFFVSTVTIRNDSPDSSVSLFLSTTPSFGGEFTSTTLTVWGQSWGSASLVGLWPTGSNTIYLTCLSEQPITIRASDRWGLPSATQIEAIKCF